jgi:hypothetical protein
MEIPVRDSSATWLSRLVMNEFGGSEGENNKMRYGKEIPTLILGGIAKGCR